MKEQVSVSTAGAISSTASTVAAVVTHCTNVMTNVGYFTSEIWIVSCYGRLRITITSLCDGEKKEMIHIRNSIWTVQCVTSASHAAQVVPCCWKHRTNQKPEKWMALEFHIKAWTKSCVHFTRRKGSRCRPGVRQLSASIANTELCFVSSWTVVRNL